MSWAVDVEGLPARALAPAEPREDPARLRCALAPAEPREDPAARLRRSLARVSRAAAGQLEGLELRAMRNPRRWARVALAAVAGAVAVSGLIVPGIRRRCRTGDPPKGGRASEPR